MTRGMRTAFAIAVFLTLVAAGCHGTLRDLPEQGGTTEKSRVEPKLSNVASSLVGEAIEVRCWSQRDWRQLIEDRSAASPHEYAGIAGEGGPVDLAPEACDPLVHALYERTRSTARGQDIVVAYAVGILAHELEHVRGEMDEQVAECQGMQRLAQVARKLGFSGPESRRLASLYWRDLYPDPERGYRTAECRDGGELDLRPRSSVWP
jgi:hypothetical protein